MKKNYKKDLRETLNKSKFLDDIWIYGNGSFKNKKDNASDLDLIFVYKKKKFEKLKLPLAIKNKIKGSIIYIPRKKRKDIMLFEKLKIFSIKKNIFLNFDINKKYHRLRELTSFIERYYERRKILKINLKELNDKKIGRIKSLIFSYFVFGRLYNFKNKKKVKNVYLKYKIIRKLYIKNKLKVNETKNFLKELKKFDDIFLMESNFILNSKYNWSDLQHFQYLFQKKYLFKYNKLRSFNVIPELFAYIYTYYSNTNLKLSKKIKTDLKCNNEAFSKNLKNLDEYLRIKIKFLNEIYIDLKKNKITSGIYRFGWYLKK